MEAKELRIGNYVNISNEDFHKDATGLTMIVSGIEQKESKYFPNSSNSLSLCFGNYIYNQMEEFVTPIKLTDEWFLKFGWRFNIITNRYKLGEWRFYIEKPPGCDGFLLCLTTNIIARDIKYVHQLQNLYFALTGEELVYSSEA